jgi:hypothetical protein
VAARRWHQTTGERERTADEIRTWWRMRWPDAEAMPERETLDVWISRIGAVELWGVLFVVSATTSTRRRKGLVADLVNRCVLLEQRRVLDAVRYDPRDREPIIGSAGDADAWEPEP